MKQKQAIIFVILMLFLILFITNFNAQTIEDYCTETSTTKECSINGKTSLSIFPVRYNDSGVWREDNLSIIKSSKIGYDYQMTKANFNVYFKNNSNTDSAVRFEKDGYFFTYDLSGGQMQWKEKPGQPASTATLGSLVPSNSQNSKVSINDKQANYVGGFSNTTIRYDLYDDMLKENFILYSLPSIKNYTYLEYTGNIKFNKTLNICANEICYTPSGNLDDFNTTGKIEFRNETNDTIFFLNEPIITDSAGTNVSGMYVVHGSNAQMNFYLRIPRVFLEKAVFPIYIDPSLVINSGTTNLGGNLNYDYVYVASGATLAVNGTGYLNIYASQNITIFGRIYGRDAVVEGTTTKGCGAGNIDGGAGAGLGAGAGGTSSYSSSSAVANGGGGATHTYGNATNMSVYSGSSGGAGGGAGESGKSTSCPSDSWQGGNGGRGAGYLVLNSSLIFINGTIDFNGQNGANYAQQDFTYGSAGGGGAGSGGEILLIGQTINMTSSNFTISGGTGGSCSAGGGSGTSCSNGGDGSGGRIKIFYQTTFDNSSMLKALGTGGTFYSVQQNLGFDNLAPTIGFTSPTPSNNSYNSTSTQTINITGTEVNLDTVNVNINGVNYTTVCSGNSPYYCYQTFSSLPDGIYNYSAYANDSTGNSNSTSTLRFTIDTVKPAIYISYPENNSFYNTLTLSINSTQTDTNLDSCWWSNDSGATNTSFSCNTNVSSVTALEGSNTWFVWANDSANNINSTTTTFIADTTFPVPSFVSPTENSGVIKKQNYILTNVSVVETNIKNITTNIYNSTGYLINSSNSSISSFYFNFSVQDGLYFYNSTTIDLANNKNDTQTRNITLDNAPPAISITSPTASNYANNDSIDLNFSVSDIYSTIDSCWYKITNSSGAEIIPNTSLALCANSTFALPGGDIDYTLTLYSNDSLNNLNSTTKGFGIRTTSPAISLNYPLNNTYLNNLSNIYFNFTATISGTQTLDTCYLYGNFNGTWSKNYTWLYPNSATMNFTILNLTERKSIWNVWCNTSLNNDDFALNNFTITTDTTKPLVSIDSITTTQGTQTFIFNSTALDVNLGVCKYSIYNSSGGIDGINNNISFSCNTKPLSATTSQYGTFNLTVTAFDLANNEDSSTLSFTTSASSGGTIGGGGGGSISESKIPVIGLNIVSSKTYNNLVKEAVYGAFYFYCENKIKGTFSVTDYASMCVLNTEDLNAIFSNLATESISVDRTDLNIFYKNYKSNDIFQGYETQTVINSYNLVPSVVGLLTFLQLTPPSIDSPIIIDVSEGNYTINYEITSNKPIKTCDVLNNNLLVSCEVKNQTITINYQIKDTNFLSQVFSGAVYITTDAEPNKVEYKRLNFVFRVYNIGYEVIDGIPAYVLALSSLAVIGFGTFIFIKRRNKKDLINILSLNKR